MPKENTYYKRQREMETQEEVKKPELHVPAVITIDEKHDLVSYEYGWFFRDRTTKSGNTNKYFSTLQQACRYLSGESMKKLAAGTTLNLAEAASLMEKATQDMVELLSADKALHIPESNQ